MPPLSLGGCDEVVQWGFDETALDGTACFNQWCLLRTGTPPNVLVLVCRFSLVFFGCARFFFLPSSLTDARQDFGPTCLVVNEAHRNK